MSEEIESERNGAVYGMIAVTLVVLFWMIFSIIALSEYYNIFEIPLIEDSQLKMGGLSAVISVIITLIVYLKGYYNTLSKSIYPDEK